MVHASMDEEERCSGTQMYASLVSFRCGSYTDMYMCLLYSKVAATQSLCLTLIDKDLFSQN